MYCPKCGTKNEKNSYFCQKCGSRIKNNDNPYRIEHITHSKLDNNTNNSNVKIQNYSKESNNYKPIQDATPKTQNTSQNTQKNNCSNYTQQPKHNIANAKVKQKGYLSNAWNDIRSQQHWIKNFVLLSLVNAIPIIGFAVTGKILQWSKTNYTDTANDNNAHKLNLCFTNKSFMLGFFEFIIWFVYGILLFVGSMVVNNIFADITIIGDLISIGVLVFGVFWHTYISMCCMKTSFSQDLGEAFNTKSNFNKFKNNVGPLFTCYFIPKLICTCISIVFFAILVCIIFSAIMPAIITIATTVSSMNLSNLANSIQAILNSSSQVLSTFFSAGFFGILIGYLGFSFISCFEKLFRYRAIYHWANKNAQDWLS